MRLFLLRRIAVFALTGWAVPTLADERRPAQQADNIGQLERQGSHMIARGQDGKSTVTSDDPSTRDGERSLAAQPGTEAHPLSNLAVGSLTAAPGFKGRQWVRRTSPAGPARGYAYSADHLVLDAQGSGVNGPTMADYGRSTSLIKRNFPSTSAPIGEMDGQLILMRQAGPVPTSIDTASDLDGLQINVQHAGDPGFIAAVEGLISRIDPVSKAETTALTIQMGVIDPFGKNQETGQGRYVGVNRLTFGYLAQAKAGDTDRAFYAANGSGGRWQDYAYFGDAGAPKFRVKGKAAGAGLDGALVLGPDGGSVTLARDGANRLTVQSSGGSAEVVATLKGAWTRYTPTVAASSGSLTATTSEGYYQIVGKRLDLRATVTVTTAGTGAGSLRITLPSGAVPAPGPICTGSGRAAASGRGLAPYAPAGSGTFDVMASDNTSIIASGARIDINLSCEIK